jgi:heme/copper-type cytochrome/quinol oxidase subunit 2
VVLGFWVGAGAAVTLAGALIGTLVPQISATINAFDLQAAAARNIDVFEALGNGVVILVGVVASLGYFHFGARRRQDGSVHRMSLIEILAWLGQIFIGITLGVVFAGVFASALTALMERASSIVQFINSLIGIP